MILEACEQLEQQWLIMAESANSCAEQREALSQASRFAKKCSHRITEDLKTIVLYEGLRYDKECFK